MEHTSDASDASDANEEYYTDDDIIYKVNHIHELYQEQDKDFFSDCEIDININDHRDLFSSGVQL